MDGGKFHKLKEDLSMKKNRPMHTCDSKKLNGGRLGKENVRLLSKLSFFLHFFQSETWITKVCPMPAWITAELNNRYSFGFKE